MSDEGIRRVVKRWVVRGGELRWVDKDEVSSKGIKRLKMNCKIMISNFWLS